MKRSQTPEKAIALEAKREKAVAKKLRFKNREELRELYRIGNPDKFTSDDIWLFVVSCFGVVLVMAAMASLNTVLPDIAMDAKASQSQLTWIVDAYTLTLAGLLLPAGAIGDRFGRKGVFIGGLIVFTIGCLIPIWWDTANALIAARAVSGLGAAFVMPSTLSILASRVPSRRRPLAIAIWGASAGIGAVLGLVGSGVILLKFEWKGIFVALAAFAALMAICSFTIEESREKKPPRFDPLGAVLSAIGIALLVLGLIEAPTAGWGHPGIIVCFIAAIAFIGGFIAWQLKCDHPLLDVRLFANRGFGSGSLSLLVQFAATFGVFYLLVQFMQLVQGYSPIKSAFSMAPLVPPCIIFALLSIWATRKIGQKWLLVFGHLILAAALLMMIGVTRETGYWYITAHMLIFATGLGLTAAPATTAIMLQTPEKKYGVASAVNDAAREIGAALGIALTGSLLTTFYSDQVTSIANKVRDSLNMAAQMGAGQPGSGAKAHDAITGGLAGAQSVAEQLSHNPMTQQLAGKLVNDAQTAFVDGQMWAAIVLAIIQIVTAIILAFWAPGFHTVKSQKDEEALNNAKQSIPIPLMAALDQTATRRHLLVATDFDGTLAPLVSNPKKSTPIPGVLEALEILADVPHTKAAIVSGRDLASLRKVAPVSREVTLVGSHGAEISDEESDLSKEQEELLKRLTEEVKQASKLIHGSHVEEKKYAVALHTRTAIKPAKAAEQVAALKDQLAAIPGVTLAHGKMVSEFAVINATKDAALESITKRWENGADAVLYLGDDITDEHIFTGLPARLASPTTEIITVKVGEGETAAQYRVDNELIAAAVIDYLCEERDRFADEHFTKKDRKQHRKNVRSRTVKRIVSTVPRR